MLLTRSVHQSVTVSKRHLALSHIPSINLCPTLSLVTAVVCLLRHNLKKIDTAQTLNRLIYGFMVKKNMVGG